MDPVYGPIKSLHRVWAGDEEVRLAPRPADR